jgi:hypothetical protein
MPKQACIKTKKNELHPQSTQYVIGKFTCHALQLTELQQQNLSNLAIIDHFQEVSWFISLIFF